ncbi:hypothetical protein RJD39_04860 [Vibrio scophthalmi]|uniref:hypothetical protein n=1 Tax=Vibrio scophthalmi TaxID=45658 RepID=UPI003873AD8E
MASFGGYPQTINYQTVNVSQGGGGSQNLLINPRGKINQANEADGILLPGQYFCDGWKAGAAGAEVYIDDDGFRLISGSILQLVPNILEPNENLRGNMDVISGNAVISINGSGDNVTVGSGEYIQFEVSGDNSKFTRMILAPGNSLPVYQQSSDELFPCLKFLFVQQKRVHTFTSGGSSKADVFFPVPMFKTPAVTVFNPSSPVNYSYGGLNSTLDGFHINSGGIAANVDGFIADARP